MHAVTLIVHAILLVWNKVFLMVCFVCFWDDMKIVNVETSVFERYSY